jgi:hypothetical protein
MTPSHYLALSLVLLTSASAEVIFSEDFENESPANNSPYKASVLRPKHNEAGKATFIVGETQNLAESSDSIGLEYDFVDSPEEQISALRIDFAFAKWNLKTVKSDKLYFGAGEYFGGDSAKMNSTSRRYLQVELNDDNTIKFNPATGKDITEDLIPNGRNTLSIFVNDHDNKVIEYAHPESGKPTTLKANMVAFYLNGKLASEASLDLEDVTASGTVGTSENNFGRFGFYSGTKSDNNAWIFDDIKVTQL